VDASQGLAQLRPAGGVGGELRPNGRAAIERGALGELLDQHLDPPPGIVGGPGDTAPALEQLAAVVLAGACQQPLAGQEPMLQRPDGDPGGHRDVPKPHPVVPAVGDLLDRRLENRNGLI
jgi:hypothetical protein